MLVPILLLALTACSRASYDLRIVKGTLIDGTGGESRREDVGITGGRIVAIGDLSRAASARTIAAAGLVVAPGFIDIHNHSDSTRLDEPRCESMIRQGVTTMILGEGESAGPVKAGERSWTTLGGYFDHVSQEGVAANIGSYVGQGQVWTHVKGYDMTPATAAELEAMKTEVDRAMRDGALGLSTSLLMPPANLITARQLADLASGRAARRHLFHAHS
jgi:N-acyl-D-aspartate/D-glutamate deacylase